MIAQILREMESAMRDRRLGWRIFEQVAGNQVVKVVGAEDRERRGEIFLERVEDAVEIHIGVDIDASFRRQPIVAEHDRIEACRAKLALSRESVGDAASCGY